MLVLRIQRIIKWPSLIIQCIKQPDGSYKPGKQLWCPVVFDLSLDGPSIYEIAGQHKRVVVISPDSSLLFSNAQIAPGDDEEKAILLYDSMIFGPFEFYRVVSNGLVGRRMPIAANDMVCLDLPGKASGVRFRPDELDRLMI